MTAIQLFRLVAFLLLCSNSHSEEPTSPLDALRAEAIPEKLRPKVPIPGLVGVIQFIPGREYTETRLGLIVQLAYSSDGKKIILGTNKPNQLRVLDAATLIDLVPPVPTRPDLAQLSPNGQRILAFTLFQLKDQRLIDSTWCPSKDSQEISKAWSPDGKRAATAGFAGSINLWDMSHGMPLILAECKADSNVTSLHYSPDGKWLASGHDNGSLRLWNMSLQPPIEVIKVPAHPNRVREVQFSRDGQYLFSIGTRAIKAQLWKHENGTLKRLGTSPESSFGFAQRIAVSPDSNRLAISRSEGAVELYKISDDEITLQWQLDRVHRSNVNAIAFSPDGKTLLSGGEDHTMVAWKIDGWLPSIHRQISGRERLFLPYWFAADGSVLLARDNTNSYAITFGEAQPKLIRLGLPFQMNVTASNQSRLVANARIDFSAFASPSESKPDPDRPTAKNLHILDLKSNDLKKLFELGGSKVASSIFSPDCKHLVELAGESGRNRIWNITGTQPQAIDFQPETPHARHFPVHSIFGSFSRSGKLLATLDVTRSKDQSPNSNQYHVSLWDASTWKRQRYWEVEEKPSNVSLSPDGTLLAGRFGNSIQLWETASGELRRTLPTENTTIGFAWSTDGTQLTTINLAGWIRRWSVATGEKVFEWSLPNYPLRNNKPAAPERNQSISSFFVWPFQLSPDGRHVAVSNTDGSIYLFRIPEHQ